MLNQTPIEREFEKFRGGPTESVAERIHVTINKEYVTGINDNCAVGLASRLPFISTTAASATLS
jgi:hypothetical protein